MDAVDEELKRWIERAKASSRSFPRGHLSSVIGRAPSVG
jgi:hypothetical protein